MEQEIAKAVRDHVWRKVKFAQVEFMCWNGGVSKTILRAVPALKMREESTKEAWDSWMSDHCRGIINDKRSAVCQSIAKEMIERRNVLIVVLFACCLFACCLLSVG